MKLLKLIISAIIIIFILVGCSNNTNSTKKHHSFKDNVATMLSVSSDGKYAITSHINKQIVLWNLQNKTYKVIAHNANIYSAYFIKHSHNFMWQNDDNNEVIIANINGNIIKTFHPGFSTYGQVITTNLNNYYASDEGWSLYALISNKKIMMKYDESGFLGIGKLLNMTLSNDDRFLLTSGSADGCPDKGSCTQRKLYIKRTKTKYYLDGVVLWDTKIQKPIYNLLGNGSKTCATISPNDKYILGGDEGGSAFIWLAGNGKRIFQLWALWLGKPVGYDKKKEVILFDSKLLNIKPPKDFRDWLNSKNDEVVALKFIDDSHYLRFTYNIPYAILYSVNSPQPIKYLKLDKKPFPAINTYVYPTIDTAPKAHILVISQAVGNGIIVYKYDPKTQTLHRTWVGNFKDN